MKSQNSRNQCFFYYFCLMIEGSGIRIRNTGRNKKHSPHGRHIHLGLNPCRHLSGQGSHGAFLCRRVADRGRGGSLLEQTHPVPDAGLSPQRAARGAGIVRDVDRVAGCRQVGVGRSGGGWRRHGVRRRRLERT
jgi:hypothetical protein